MANDNGSSFVATASAAESGAPAGSPGGAPARRAAGRGVDIQRFATLGFFLVFFLVVAAIKGSVFLSVDNVILTLGQNAHLAFVAAAATITLIAGQFDLSVGAVAGLAATLVAGFTSIQQLPVIPAILLTVVIGALAGLVNGLLVTKLNINAFIATLASASAIGGVALIYANNQIIYNGIPEALTTPGKFEILHVPLPVFYAGALLFLGWGLTRHTVLGRFWYAVGANPEAARLAGVNVGRMTMWALVTAGTVAAIGGVIMTARFGSADPTTGPGLLLPAYAAAFLGSSILSDGKFTVVGTIIATFLVAFAQNGIDVLGLSAGVKPIFNGFVLAAAVALSEGLRRRGRRLVRSGSR
ncbi:ABC transporter permease [Acrocarpospora catenulata]|uniref:ABC transporter permease n=1 Tax=Acrocarpospora catenulata TaxID=2836182 RepID=UPI001BD9AACA|nr:ABC transporter permease [Acrocarpospora catenulata]